jgi:hypothetical protein
MNVVEQIPADMVGVLVYDEIIAAVPAPICTNWPVPGSNFKVKTARQPEAVMIWIEAFNSVTVRGAKMFETAMLERMVNVEALIVRPVVPVPVVLVDVWGRVFT